ncbi:MAG: UDP-3-O-(3-hydroxymyristoyl)glucosamine N-acyltransferase [Acidobacteriaceae bacterium]
MKLVEVARELGLELAGDSEIEITGVAGLESAQPGDISFLSNPKYGPMMKTTKASAVIVDAGFPEVSVATLRGSNPYYAFARAIELFYQPRTADAGVHPTAVINPTALLGSNPSIGPYAVIGAGVVIGDDCVFHSHVVVYPHVRIGNRFLAHSHAVVREGCVIGDDVVLQNGAVIGTDGFGFANDHAGNWYKIKQSGPAVLEDRVEVQANACVDRATVGETRIRAGAKLDNLVQVGHGCDVGEETLLCAQVGLAGSTKVGKKVIIAGQAGVAGHCTIGDGAIITAQAGTVDVEPGKIVSGSPAFDNRQWLRAVAVFNRLPDIIRELRSAIKQASALQERN